MCNFLNLCLLSSNPAWLWEMRSLEFMMLMLVGMALEIWPSLVLPVLFVVNSLICRGCSTRGCHWRWWWGWWSSRALSTRRSQSPPGCPTWRWVVKCICTFYRKNVFYHGRNIFSASVWPMREPKRAVPRVAIATRSPLNSIRCGQEWWASFWLDLFWFGACSVGLEGWRWVTEESLDPPGGVEAPWRSPRYTIKHAINRGY